MEASERTRLHRCARCGEEQSAVESCEGDCYPLCGPCAAVLRHEDADVWRARLDAAERERDDAREDLARIGRLVECDSLVGVEIHAAVEHVVRHELDAARDAAERAERERDDARAEVETLRAEAAMLREIIEGRTVAPADVEIAAHEARKGRWLLSHPSSHVHDHRVCYVLDPGTSDIRGEAAHPHEGSRFVALDANGRPCAWPTVTP